MAVITDPSWQLHLSTVLIPFLRLGHVSREGDEDFFTSELFGLWEGLGIKWVEEEKRKRENISSHQRRPLTLDASEASGGRPQDLKGPSLSVARLLAALRGESFDCHPE